MRSARAPSDSHPFFMKSLSIVLGAVSIWQVLPAPFGATNGVLAAQLGGQVLNQEVMVGQATRRGSSACPMPLPMISFVEM